ncbi:MAG: hypothetical protein IJV22_00610 [Bacteroidales bacterium]|nr:hypothetical protein [Bacteroidales bacterium]
MRRTLATLLLLMMATACSGPAHQTILDQTVPLENRIWQRFDTKTFNFDIADNESGYSLTVTADFDTAAFTLSALPIIINIYDPAGNRRMFTSELPLRDQRGTLTGEMQAGLLHTTTTLRSYMFFSNGGEQRIELKQGTSKYEIHGIANVGLTIRKVKPIKW